MAGKKSKDRSSQKPFGKQRSSASGKGGRKKWTGPRLPNAMKEVVERLNPSGPVDSEGEEDEGGFGYIGGDESFGDDIYEYEGEVAQEESGKNRRFDPVDNLEYELPENFEDEDILSDGVDTDDDGIDDGRKKIGEGSDSEEEDNGRHARLLQGITGMPSELFEGKKKRIGRVVSESYPESAYNPSRDVLDGDGQISRDLLLGSLQGKPGYSQLLTRKRQLEKKSAPNLAPLPKPERERVERQVAYEHSKKEIVKWEPLVKRNREASTLYFDEDIDLKFSTVGAIASEFEPRTEFEKKIASLVYDEKVAEAHKKDGARLLELNKVSIEDEKERRDRIAKMRSLLFRHEMKQKHIKKIKSKTYHRLLKKDRLKDFSAQLEMDPEAAKEQARKQEFKRAEERLTLKHKNNSKWAKRILQRGLDAQDDGTRAAISEQLQRHALLTRKMNSAKENSSSSDDSSNEDDDSAGSDQDVASKVLARAKEKTLEVLEEEDVAPASGVLSLPFMVRGLKKRKEAAIEEAKLALDEYEIASKQMEDSREVENARARVSGARMVFGGLKAQNQTQDIKSKPERTCDDSDTEEDVEVQEDNDTQKQGKEDSQIAFRNGFLSLDGDSQDLQRSVFESIERIVEPGAKTTYEVSIFESDSWRKMKDEKKVVKEVETTGRKKKREVAELATLDKHSKELSEGSDSESEGQMVDGILSSAPTRSYELPSQADLVRQAFAGDDVEADFEKDKQEILNAENPEPEKPVLLPGWGQWTNVQKKKGLPSWMLKEHDDAKSKREEALKKRKDAGLNNVILSEKVDKKAEKLQLKVLPYPYTSKEVFEQSIRMPIGPEFNPATAIGALNRPEVVKRPGIKINPIKFKEVNPHEKGENYWGSEQKSTGKRKRADAKAGKKKASKMRS